MNSEKIAQIALTLVNGIGVVTTRYLIKYFLSAENVFKASKKELVALRGIGDALANEILKKNTFDRALQIIQTAEKQSANCLFFTEDDYPEHLKYLYDAPPLLYYSGNVHLNSLIPLAIVGTRNATEYGRKVTEKIIEELQSYPVLIVSGLAYGIDITAHKACLKYSLPTIGVMASGLGIIYPSKHAKIAEQMLESGGLLTEQPFGEKPDTRYFPARNRIIAGMTIATLVVEASEKGGALITAEYANNYNREVLSVPGGIYQPFSSGCNTLIHQNKAQIYTSVQDILEVLSLTPVKQTIEKQTMLSLFTHEESIILSLLRQKSPLHIDELIYESKMDASKLASVLLNLEFQNHLKTLPGKMYNLT